MFKIEFKFKSKFKSTLKLLLVTLLVWIGAVFYQILEDIPPRKFLASVTKVSDGDTVTIDILRPILNDNLIIRSFQKLFPVVSDEKTLKIRLFGIDCPEYTQEHGKEAGAVLRSLILGKAVEIFIHGQDKYRRYVGSISVSERDVNLYMVEEGHCWWFERFAADAKAFEIAQQKARREQKNLWSRKNPTPPWDYRRQKRHR